MTHCVHDPLYICHQECSPNATRVEVAAKETMLETLFWSTRQRLRRLGQARLQWTARSDRQQRHASVKVMGACLGISTEVDRVDRRATKHQLRPALPAIAGKFLDDI